MYFRGLPLALILASACTDGCARATKEPPPAAAPQSHSIETASPPAPPAPAVERGDDGDKDEDEDEVRVRAASRARPKPRPKIPSVVPLTARREKQLAELEQLPDGLDYAGQRVRLYVAVWQFRLTGRTSTGEFLPLRATVRLEPEKGKRLPEDLSLDYVRIIKDEDHDWTPPPPTESRGTQRSLTQGPDWSTATDVHVVAGVTNGKKRWLVKAVTSIGSLY